MDNGHWTAEGPGLNNTLGRQTLWQNGWHRMKCEFKVMSYLQAAWKWSLYGDFRKWETQGKLQTLYQKLALFVVILSYLNATRMLTLNSSQVKFISQLRAQISLVPTLYECLKTNWLSYKRRKECYTMMTINRRLKRKESLSFKSTADMHRLL